MSTKRIKICFIAPKAYPIFQPNCEGVFGGAEVDLFFIATELAKDHNYEVSFIVADYGQPTVEVIDNVKLLKSLRFKANQISSSVNIWRAMKKADSDIYFIKTTSAGTFLTALFCKLNGKRFIYRSAHTEHCDGTWLRKHPFAGIFFRWALNHSSSILVQNESDKVALLETMRLNSTVLANAHRLDIDKISKEKNIIWVGRSAAFKQPEMFLKLASENPGNNFVMICQESTCDRNYQQLQEKAGKISNLKFIDRVPFQEINKYFAAARVFVNTSIAEGFPNTFIQATMTGTPILSLGVNPDGFLDKYNCGICVNNDTSKLTAALETILNDYDRYSQAAREYAVNRHDISKTINEYKKIFSQSC